jgi:hypothetical protein
MRATPFSSVLGLLVLASLGGCASAPRVTAIDGELYHVAAQGMPYDSQADTNHRAFVAATAYCDSQGKALLFRQSQESGAHSFSSKREDMTFTCLSAADPGYLNAGLRRDGARTAEPLVAQQ